MAEEKISGVDGGTIVEPDESKVDQELERSRGDSDEASGGSLSEDDCGQRRGSDSDQRHRKGRRQRRWKGGKRHNRKHHPYAGMSYADRVAMKAGANSEFPHAPRNTTQYLIEDHVKSNISPDLSNKASPASIGDEVTDVSRTAIVESGAQEVLLEVKEGRGRPQDSPNLTLPFTPSERLEYDQEFVAVYDNVNEDRLYNMSREELIRMTSRLLERVEGGRRAADVSKDETVAEGLRESPNTRLRESPNTTPLSSCN